MSTMTTVRIQDGALSVRFSRLEKIAGLVRDQHIPLAAVSEVEVVADGLDATHGLRAPGLALPGRRKVGTWRSRGGKSLIAVRGRGAAVRLTLEGQRYASMLLSVDDPEGFAASLSSRTGG